MSDKAYRTLDNITYHALSGSSALHSEILATYRSFAQLASAIDRFSLSASIYRLLIIGSALGFVLAGIYNNTFGSIVFLLLLSMFIIGFDSLPS